MSSDGSQMAACGYGEIWTSMDTGATWFREANFDTDAYLRGGGEDVAWSKILRKNVASPGDSWVTQEVSVLPASFATVNQPFTSVH